jgi:hypothetical protein
MGENPMHDQIVGFINNTQSFNIPLENLTKHVIELAQNYWKEKCILSDVVKSLEKERDNIKI